MIKEIQLRVVPQVAYSEQNISEYVSREYGIDRRTIKHLRILKRSIDARQRQIYVNLSVRVYINELPSDELFTPIDYPAQSPIPNPQSPIPNPHKRYLNEKINF